MPVHKGPVRPPYDTTRVTPRQGSHDTDAGAPDDATVGRARAAAAALSQRATPAAAAHDPGEVLADIPRSDGTRLQVAWCEYQGKPFVRLALWKGGWIVPGKQACVRRSELGAVLEALILACEKASGWRG